MGSINGGVGVGGSASIKVGGGVGLFLIRGRLGELGEKIRCRHRIDCFTVIASIVEALTGLRVVGSRIAIAVTVSRIALVVE